MVIDASVSLAWLLPDEGSGYADAVLERVAAKGAVVPPLWALEVANALVTAERRKRLTWRTAQRGLALLRALDIREVATARDDAFGSIARLARERGLTVYDATYLALAEREALALASLDAKLLAAARALGLETI